MKCTLCCFTHNSRMVCSIGVFLKGQCAKSKNFSSQHFTTREWSLYKLRSGVSNLESICKLHAQRYGRLYGAAEKICCNPLNLHIETRRKNLIRVTAQSHDLYNKNLEKVIEGRKLCNQCYRAVKNNGSSKEITLEERACSSGKRCI